jgi:hypothetical protein
MDSDMQGGPVDELLGMAVQRPALDQLEVEVGRTLEDRVRPGLTADHREERHLDALSSDASMPEASICACARYVLAPKTIRCSALYKARRRSRNSGPCLPQ